MTPSSITRPPATIWLNIGVIFFIVALFLESFRGRIMRESESFGKPQDPFRKSTSEDPDLEFANLSSVDEQVRRAARALAEKQTRQESRVRALRDFGDSETSDRITQ